MPVIYIFMGLIASGKSTLAERFAQQYDLPYYNTDRVRKELAGMEAQQHQDAHLNQGIYTREFSQRTYQEMLDRAAGDIRSGKQGVVLDGSYHLREERDRVRLLAKDENAATEFVLCQCGDDEVRRRLEERARDPLAVSDGRWEIYLAQKDTFQVPDALTETDLLTLQTEHSVSELLAILARKWKMSVRQDIGTTGHAP